MATPIFSSIEITYTDNDTVIYNNILQYDRNYSEKILRIKYLRDDNVKCELIVNLDNVYTVCAVLKEIEG